MNPVSPQVRSGTQTSTLLDPKEEESIFEHYMAMMDKANKETKAEAERKWQESKREFTREAHRYQWQHIFATEIRVKKGK